MPDFWQLTITTIFKIEWFPWSMFIFNAKTFLILYHQPPLENSPTRITINMGTHADFVRSLLRIFIDERLNNMMLK